MTSLTTSYKNGSSGSRGDTSNTYGIARKVSAYDSKHDADDSKQPEKTRREAPSKHWCFTWNNYPDGWFQWFQGSDLWGAVEKYIMGREVGEEKETPHLQCYVAFKTKKRFSQILKSWPDIQHLRTARNVAASIKYCTKDGDYESNMSLPRPVTFTENFNRPWQLEILKLLKTTPDNRTIHWYWEPDGNAGKSRFCKYLVVNHEARMIPSKQNDAFHAIAKLQEEYKSIDVIVIDIPRVNEKFVSYAAIEAIKNGLVCSGKYEGATCVFAEPHVIVFANFEPNYDVLSRDRWQVRRITMDEEKDEGGTAWADEI